MSRYWMRYKFWRFWLWVGWVVLGSFGVIGAIILYILIRMQGLRWHAHQLDLISGSCRCQVNLYAQLRHGRLERYEHYFVEEERSLKRERRRATYRVGIGTRHRMIWAYFTKVLPNGLMQPENPAAFKIAELSPNCE